MDRRVHLLDAVRGFALLGLFLVHMVELFELYWAHPTPNPVFDQVFLIFAGKSFALFALCFGVSFSLIMDRAAARGEAVSRRFLWRLTILLGIGLLHGLVYRGDILQVLALLGVVLLLVNRIRDNRVVLGLAILSLAQIPLLARAGAASLGMDWANQPPGFWTDPSMGRIVGGSLADVLSANTSDGLLTKWSFFIETGRLTQILGLFGLGLVLGRIGFFSTPERFITLRRAVLAGGAAAFLILSACKPALLSELPAMEAGFMTRQSVEWALDNWIAIALMSAQLVALVEIHQSFGRRVVELLAPVGRMTLTLYVGQSLVFVPVFYDFGLGLHDRMTSGEALTLGLVAFLLQVVFAHLWFRRFRYGPLEWGWRALTLGTLRVPFLRDRAAEAPG